MCEQCNNKEDEEINMLTGGEEPTIIAPSDEESTYDFAKMKESVKLFLEATGHPDWQNDPNTIETPERVAKMWKVMLEGYNDDPKKYLKTFPGVSKDMVIVKDIAALSFCSHHLLPFYGKVAIAYVPNGKLVGLSKLVRFARCHLKKLQLQERLTAQIADTLTEVLEPSGVMVFCEFVHTCMTVRGVRSPGAVTVTSAVRGLFETDSSLKEEFMFAINRPSNVFNY